MKTATLVKDNIFETDRIATSFVCGFIKPKIFIPVGVNEAELIDKLNSMSLDTVQTVKDDKIDKKLSDKSKGNPIIRAEGISKFGRIIITANGEEQTGQLGADSSYGKSSDYTFNADYNVIFNDLSNKKKTIGTINHDNIAAIIQPENTPVKMQKVIINDDELFIFIPQYASSNDVPLYIFCVNKNGKASQVKFQFDTNSEPIDGASIITLTSSKYSLPQPWK